LKKETRRRGKGTEKKSEIVSVKKAVFKSTTIRKNKGSKGGGTQKRKKCLWAKKIGGRGNRLQRGKLLVPREARRNIN